MGLSIDVPADQQTRRVTIWTSGWESEAEFTATLSDGSAPAYLVILSPHNIPGNFHMHKHTIEYSAGRNGETLTLKIVKTLSTPGAITKGQEGNVKFNAIMLQEL